MPTPQQYRRDLSITGGETLIGIDDTTSRETVQIQIGDLVGYLGDRFNSGGQLRITSSQVTDFNSAVDARVTGGVQIDNAAIDARIADWAEEGNTQVIPVSKIEESVDTIIDSEVTSTYLVNLGFETAATSQAAYRPITYGTQTTDTFLGTAGVAQNVTIDSSFDVGGTWYDIVVPEDVPAPGFNADYSTGLQITETVQIRRNGAGSSGEIRVRANENAGADDTIISGNQIAFTDSTDTQTVNAEDIRTFKNPVDSTPALTQTAGTNNLVAQEDLTVTGEITGTLVENGLETSREATPQPGMYAVGPIPSANSNIDIVGGDGASVANGDVGSVVTFGNVTPLDTTLSWAAGDSGTARSLDNAQVYTFDVTSFTAGVLTGTITAVIATDNPTQKGMWNLDVNREFTTVRLGGMVFNDVRQGTLAAPPTGLVVGEAWVDNTDPTQPVMRVSILNT